VNPTTAILVLARTLGLGATAPALAAPGLEPRFRLLLAIALAAVIAPVVGPSLAVPSGWSAIALACLGEVVVGAALGWSAGLIIAGARQAGEIVGAQAGLSAAALFDPEAGDELTPLGHLYGLIALGVFLALDGPLMLVRCLAESYETLPVGGLGLTLETAEVACGRVGHALALAVRAAAPTAIALSLAGIALGLIGRAAPSLPLATMSLPVRYVLGLLLAMLGAVALVGTVAAAWSAWPVVVTSGG
jgi:flagellar biosynthetic protein FliR